MELGQYVHWRQWHRRTWLVGDTQEKAEVEEMLNEIGMAF